jgi:hypothetical protein
MGAGSTYAVNDVVIMQKFERLEQSKKARSESEK